MTLTTPDTVVMIRPHAFSPNEETAWDNHFQSDTPQDAADLALNAQREVTEAARVLTAHGVNVQVFENGSERHPDAVFPNNWFSTHPCGRVALYPMAAANRRGERRTDVVDWLKQHYRVTEVIDFSAWELDACYLEGTGSMVLDHQNRLSFTAVSHRSNPKLVDRFCHTFDYEPCVFRTADDRGAPIYHTNVLLCVAQHFALVGMDWVHPEDRDSLRQRLQAGGRTVIELTPEQIRSFAGNALELAAGQGTILALSRTAYNTLTDEQKRRIEQTTTLVPLSVPTIELAGGSVRCMLAGVHLPSR